MSKKDSTKETSFKNNPFKSVKGFSVSEPTAPKKAAVSKPPSRRLQGEEDEQDFGRAMAQLGVAQLDDELTTLEREPAFAEQEECPAEPDPELELDDDSLFVASLGQLDCVFSDELPDDESDDETRAEPRRMKQLRQGKLRPQDRLDLHGCYRDEARKKVRHFLQHRYAEGLTTVLIITGRGNHSRGGESVLRQDIERYLKTHAAAWVAEWGRAPRQYGGDGALVVFLRQKK